MLNSKKKVEDNLIQLYDEAIQNYELAAKKRKLKDRPTTLFEKIIDGVEIQIP
ncbi:MAG: hypothetical protein U9R42_14925 [Bacteroidota bacterium]|nr:hypothetical protein [Bacteroidota bacterium]